MSDDDNVIPMKQPDKPGILNVECENCKGSNFKIVDFQLMCDHCWEVTEGYMVIDLDDAMMGNIFNIKRSDDKDKDKDKDKD